MSKSNPGTYTQDQPTPYELTERGWYVFPADHPELDRCAGLKTETHNPETCVERGKHPTVKWDTGATIAPANVSHFFSGYPRNVAIHCGKSGLLVVDEDAPGEFARYAADHGVKIPETYTVETAKGKHYYFRDTEGGALGNREGAFADYAINIRSGVGYVIAAGSEHASGTVYSENGVRTTVTLPHWIPEGVKARRSNGTESTGGVGFELPDVIKDGHRDNDLFAFACSLRAQSINYATAKVVMLAAWLRCEQPPIAKTRFTWEQALAKLDQAWKYEEGRSSEYASTGDDFTSTGEDAAGRWVDLDGYLDGTYLPPSPSVGAPRDDMIQMLYPERWHTVVGLTTAGKTTLALWHVKAVLEEGGHVIYIHFEEASPNGIIHRLKGLGVDPDLIRKQFHWGDVNTAWRIGEMTKELESLDQTPTLAVLDGINAACGIHSWSVKEPESVGKYRQFFVTPLTSTGCAVLSLGHPPKDPKRQNESYSYGAAGWLNDVDGASYWLTASKQSPMDIGKSGSSALCLVKDRYGEVKRWGNLQTDKEMAQWYMGQFIVDDSIPGVFTGARLSIPVRNEEGEAKDAIDEACDTITSYLREHGQRFKTKKALEDGMRSKKFHISQNNITPALIRLVEREVIEWPEVASGGRPGWLIVTAFAFDPDAPASDTK
jgi:hypothetical protein